MNFKTNVDLTQEVRKDLAATKRYPNVSQQAIIKMALLEFQQKHRGLDTKPDSRG